MKRNKQVKNPIGRRQTSSMAICTSATEELNQELTETNPAGVQGGTWTRDLQISSLAPWPRCLLITNQSTSEWMESSFSCSVIVVKSVNNSITLLRQFRFVEVTIVIYSNGFSHSLTFIQRYPTYNNLPFDNGDMSSPKRHDFISLLFFLKDLHPHWFSEPCCSLLIVFSKAKMCIADLAVIKKGSLFER